MELWEDFDGNDYDYGLEPVLDNCLEIIKEFSEEEIKYFKSILGKYSFNELDVTENFVINLIILGADRKTILKTAKIERLSWKEKENYAMMKIVQIDAFLRAQKKAKNHFDPQTIEQATPLS